MRLFASLLFLLGFSPTVLLAQVPQIPPEIQERVLRDLAALWDVEPDDLELEWIRQRGLEGFPFFDSTSFRLLGSERTGIYTIVFDAEDRGGVHSALLRVGAWREVPVATRTLSPGDTLEADDFTLERRLRWGRPVQDSQLEPAVGWIVQNTIRSGEVIRTPLVMPPTILQAGDSVVVLVRRNGVRIELTGTAMKSARYGDEIFVKLDGDRGYVRAKVHDRGVVIIDEG